MGWALGAPYMFKYVFKKRKIYKKSFEALTNQEIYDILDLRYTVFMMEQDIIYVIQIIKINLLCIIFKRSKKVKSSLI